MWEQYDWAPRVVMVVQCAMEEQAQAELLKAAPALSVSALGAMAALAKVYHVWESKVAFPKLAVSLRTSELQISQLFAAVHTLIVLSCWL